MEHDGIARQIERMCNEVIDAGGYDAYDEVFAPDYVDHTPMGDLVGKQGLMAFVEPFRAAIADLRHEIADVRLIPPDVVQWRIRVTGHFTGSFLGVEGARQPIDLYVANAARIARDGRLAEHWAMGPDSMAEMLAQMGVAAPGAALTRSTA